MTPMQFVACSATECPFNESKTCRAPYITIDADGKCMILKGGPFTGKAEVERHVEIRSCSCEECAHFERDPLDDNPGVPGVCALNEPLFFSKELSDGVPICSTFAKQINAPPYSIRI